MRFLWGIIFLFLTQLMTGQNLLPIDTLQAAYREQMLAIYSQRVEKQQKLFRDKYDRKVWKEATHTYEGFTLAFREKIREGYFVENKAYQEVFDTIINRLIKGNPTYAQTLKQTKILLSYGRSPNAYAIGNNIVVVYITLLKKIRNQYELAFILSHEIAHNIENHSIHSIVSKAKLNTSREFKQKTRRLSRKKYDRGIAARRMFRNVVYDFTQHSRQQEQQADSLGFVLFNNSYKKHRYEAVASLNYLNQIDAMRDSLTTADLKTFFSTSELAFEKQLLNNQRLLEYKYDDAPEFWEIDSLKTHPDCVLRAAYLKNHFAVEKVPLSLPSAQFKKIKEASRYNSIFGLYEIEEYGRSLYLAFLLFKQQPEDGFLRGMIAKNFQKIQEARLSYTLGQYVDRLSPLQSISYNRFIYILRNLRSTTINALIDHYNP